MPSSTIYAARPRGLDGHFFVGFTRQVEGPRTAFNRLLPNIRFRNDRIAALMDRFYSAHEWEVIVLEVDETFEGDRAALEERRRFYMYWLQQEYQATLLNRVHPLALNPTWQRTWSVLDQPLLL